MWVIVRAKAQGFPTYVVSFASTHLKNLENTTHKEKKQDLWPDHCLQYSEGAKFVQGLHTEKIAHVFYKGEDMDDMGYSPFSTKKNEVTRFLLDENVYTLYLVGVATDLCVKYTALDAKSCGFEVCD